MKEEKQANNTQTKKLTQEELRNLKFNFDIKVPKEDLDRLLKEMMGV